MCTSRHNKSNLPVHPCKEGYEKKGASGERPGDFWSGGLVFMECIPPALGVALSLEREVSATNKTQEKVTNAEALLDKGLGTAEFPLFVTIIQLFFGIAALSASEMLFGSPPPNTPLCRAAAGEDTQGLHTHRLALVLVHRGLHFPDLLPIYKNITALTSLWAFLNHRTY